MMHLKFEADSFVWLDTVLIRSFYQISLRRVIIIIINKHGLIS